jgi:hypothetical protein
MAQIKERSDCEDVHNIREALSSYCSGPGSKKYASVSCKTIKYETNFDAPDAHFDDAQVEKLEIRKKRVKTVKEPIKAKQSAIKLSQIRRRIELCMRKIILHFEMNL